MRNRLSIYMGSIAIIFTIFFILGSSGCKRNEPTEKVGVRKTTANVPGVGMISLLSGERSQTLKAIELPKSVSSSNQTVVTVSIATISKLDVTLGRTRSFIYSNGIIQTENVSTVLLEDDYLVQDSLVVVSSVVLSSNGPVSHLNIINPRAE